MLVAMVDLPTPPFFEPIRIIILAILADGLNSKKNNFDYNRLFWKGLFMQLRWFGTLQKCTELRIFIGRLKGRVKIDE